MAASSDTRANKRSRSRQSRYFTQATRSINPQLNINNRWPAVSWRIDRHQSARVLPPAFDHHDLPGAITTSDHGRRSDTAPAVIAPARSGACSASRSYRIVQRHSLVARPQRLDGDQPIRRIDCHAGDDAGWRSINVAPRCHTRHPAASVNASGSIRKPGPGRIRVPMLVTNGFVHRIGPPDAASPQLVIQRRGYSDHSPLLYCLAHVNRSPNLLTLSRIGRHPVVVVLVALTGRGRISPPALCSVSRITTISTARWHETGCRLRFSAA